MHPVLVRLRHLRVLEVLQVEIDDRVVEESPNLEGFVILQGDSNTANPLNRWFGKLTEIFEGGWLWRRCWPWWWGRLVESRLLRLRLRRQTSARDHLLEAAHVVVAQSVGGAQGEHFLEETEES